MKSSEKRNVIPNSDHPMSALCSMVKSGLCRLHQYCITHGLLYVSPVFCIYYITRGILQENRQELIVFVLSVLVVMMRSVVNFMVLPFQDRKDLLLVRCMWTNKIKPTPMSNPGSCSVRYTVAVFCNRKQQSVFSLDKFRYYLPV